MTNRGISEFRMDAVVAAQISVIAFMPAARLMGFCTVGAGGAP